MMATSCLVAIISIKGPLMRVVALILFFIMLTGCAISSGLENPESSPVVPGSPDSTEVASSAILGENNGGVVGYLHSSGNQTPIVGIGIYLGEFLPLDPGPGFLITLEQNESPHTRTDNEGYFEISNVPPGEYPIIVWTPVRSQVIADDSGERELIVIIEAGKETDLGVIEVDWR
jgi:hypothetical protein